jgi:hypothetical protein
VLCVGQGQIQFKCVSHVQRLTLQSSIKHTGLEPLDLSSISDKTLAEFGLKIKQRSTLLCNSLSPPAPPLTTSTTFLYLFAFLQQFFIIALCLFQTRQFNLWIHIFLFFDELSVRVFQTNESTPFFSAKNKKQQNFYYLLTCFLLTFV